jgi:hypothetical protein
MTSSARPPLQIGPLISAAIARVWHFKLELGILWLAFLLSALIILPFSRGLEAQFTAAIQAGKPLQDVKLDGGSVVSLAVVTVILVLFECALVVLWLRLLRLGTVLAFDGGLKMLLVRTLGLFLRCFALVMVFLGGLLVIVFVLDLVLRSILGPGATIAVSFISAQLLIVLIFLAFLALAIRVSFALVSPVFDTPTPIEHAWAMLGGNTLRILTAIVAVCFPILFLGSIVQSAVVRFGPVAQDATAAAVATPGTGMLLALALVGSIANCLEIAVATAILIEAYDRLGGWSGGRFVSEIV